MSKPTFSPLRVATLNAIQRGEFDDILHKIHFNWSINRVQCRNSYRQSNASEYTCISLSDDEAYIDHPRPVEMVATEQGWYCPICESRKRPETFLYIEKLIFPLAFVEACEREFELLNYNCGLPFDDTKYLEYLSKV